VRYFEDFQVGDVVDLGSRMISQEEIIAFAQQYDPQPFHIDPVQARGSMFGGLAASGWHTCCLYMRLLVDNLLLDTDSMGSPGLEELRWLKPVRPGDTLHARLTVLESKPSRSRPEMGILRCRAEMVNQHDELVLSMVNAVFFGRRPA